MSTEVIFPLEGKRVWVAGHNGMVGSALMRRLARENCEILTIDRKKIDLKDQAATRAWIMDAKPDAVFLAAARAGGILANDTYPVDFLYDNLMIEGNVIEAAYRAKVSKLLFLGSSCIYPKMAPQPIPEEALLTGPLEPTNEWYAVAKIAGIKLCQAYRKQYRCDFISAMPTNLYGPGDNFDLNTSHVIPALLRKVHEAKLRGNKEIVIWGTGTPRREFLHVDDCADACVHLMKVYSSDSHINVGSGHDLTILELTKLVCEIASFTGEITHDLSKSDGTPCKLMGAGKIRAHGWSPKIALSDGLALTFRWYLENRATSKAAAVSEKRVSTVAPIARDNIKTTRILGVPVSVVNMQSAVAAIVVWAKSGVSSYICVRDVHGVMLAQKDAELLAIHEKAGLVTPDGMPLVWIARLTEGKAVGRVCGADLVDALCAVSESQGLRHYYYGGKPGVANDMALALQARYPGLNVVGTFSPPFGVLSKEADDEITRNIVAAKPHIVWVGLSTPKQEFWMRDHVGRIPGATLIGVGAAFDFHTGIVSRAPIWMQRAGLEWFHRLISEPRRLWRRYLITAPKFALLALGEQISGNHVSRIG